MIDKPKLISLRSELEKTISNFPYHGCCAKVAGLVHNTTGFEIVEGIIITEIGPQHHIFNYDKNTKHFVDLSADQFSKYSKKVMITPLNNNIYHGVRQR